MSNKSINKNVLSNFLTLTWNHSRKHRNSFSWSQVDLRTLSRIIINCPETDLACHICQGYLDQLILASDIAVSWDQMRGNKSLVYIYMWISEINELNKMYIYEWTAAVLGPGPSRWICWNVRAVMSPVRAVWHGVLF